MKKVLISLVTVLCIICLVKQPVSAATYTEEEIMNGNGFFEVGDILQFDNPTTIIINDHAGQQIFKQNGNTITIPSYSQEIKSFKGYNITGTLTNGGNTTIILKPFFRTGIIVNEVTDGESITISVPADQIPFAAGTYKTEWITGGPAGGVGIEEAPKDSLTWTIDATSSEYVNGAIFAMVVVDNNSGEVILSEEAVLVIKPKQAIVNPGEPKKKVVATADAQPVFVSVLLMGVAMGLALMLRKKSIQ